MPAPFIERKGRVLFTQKAEEQWSQGKGHFGLAFHEPSNTLLIGQSAEENLAAVLRERQKLSSEEEKHIYTGQLSNEGGGYSFEISKKFADKVSKLLWNAGLKTMNR
jgi:hypothetical protein